MNLIKTAGVLSAGVLVGGAVAWGHGGDASKVHACTTGEGQPILLSSPNGSCGAGTPLDWAIQGPPGPAGARGPEGPKGDPGPPAPTRFVAVKRSKRGPAGAGVVTVTASCPKGSLAVSGGYRITGDFEHAQMVRSGPLLGGSRPTGWVAQGRSGKHQTGWSLEATALCARS